jgi:hypothetical protein
MQTESWVAWFCAIIGITDPVAVSFAVGSVAVMALLLAATISLAIIATVIRWIVGA